MKRPSVYSNAIAVFHFGLFMIFSRRSKISSGLLLIVLSAFTIACSDESSNNTSNGVNDSQTISTDENGNRIVTSNDTVVEIDPEGNATILDDPSGSATVTDNSDGGDTVNLDDGEIVTTSDGGISRAVSGDNVVRQSDIFLESEDE